MIVLRGYGLGGIDSGSTVVAWGIARDLDGEPVESVIANTDISQLFVIDFGMGRRKPTKAEIRTFKRISALISMRGLQFTERKGKKGRTEFDVFAAPLFKKAA